LVPTTYFHMVSNAFPSACRSCDSSARSASHHSTLESTKMSTPFWRAFFDCVWCGERRVGTGGATTASGKHVP